MPNRVLLYIGTLSIVNSHLCGDTVCDPWENCETCSDDCGICNTITAFCGNNICEYDESCSKCPADCTSGCSIDANTFPPNLPTCPDGYILDFNSNCIAKPPDCSYMNGYWDGTQCVCNPGLIIDTTVCRDIRPEDCVGAPSGAYWDS